MLTKSFLIKQMRIKGAAKLKIWLLSDIKTHQLTMCIGHWLPGKEPPWNGSEHLHVHTLWWWMRPWVNESDILHLSIPLCHCESLCTDGDKTSSHQEMHYRAQHTDIWFEQKLYFGYLQAYIVHTVLLQSVCIFLHGKVVLLYRIVSLYMVIVWLLCIILS